MTSPAHLEAVETFLVESADALHRQGLPSSRIETAIWDMAEQLGAEVTLFATPTSLMLAFGPPPAQRVTILRVQPAELDLGRLAELSDLTQEVANGLDLERSQHRLRAILDAPTRWPAWLDLLCSAILSGGAAVLFGGGPNDIGCAALLGLVTGVLWLASRRFAVLEDIWLPLTAFLATMLSGWLASADPSLQPGIIALSGIIFLVPGLSFTLAMIELASRSLTSGVASLGGAMVTLFKLGLGVAVANHLAPSTPHAALEPASLAPWVLPVALLITPPAVGELMHAKGRDLPAIAAFSLLAWGGATLGDTWFGPIAGAGLGALVLGASTNIYSLLTQRPAIIPMVTGLLLLVPGSIGFRSVAALLHNDVVLGVEQAFRMVMVAGSLAGGLVASSAVFHTRRAM